jgi:hypothetical protein
VKLGVGGERRAIEQRPPRRVGRAQREQRARLRGHRRVVGADARVELERLGELVPEP